MNLDAVYGAAIPLGDTFQHAGLVGLIAINLADQRDFIQRSNKRHSSAIMRSVRSIGRHYFRDEFVVRRKWIDEHAYADLVGLCQFLPGPASSQAGFSIGLMRAGYLGALAAWTGFTLPSAVILVLFAYGAGALSGSVGAGLLHGLKLTAVAIVAQAVWGMARNLCPDRERASIAVIAALIILFSTASIAQIGAIVLSGLAWRAPPLIVVAFSAAAGIAMTHV